MSWVHFTIPVLITTFTGWLIVRTCTWFVFHPLQPKNILGFKLQGVFPDKQQLIAEKLGKIAANEFSFTEMEEKVINPENLAKLKPEIEQHIDHFLREKLKISFPMLSAFIGEKTINQLKAAFLMELESLFPVLMKSYIGRLQHDIDLERIVTNKISALSPEILEPIFTQITKKPFRQLELLGASFGFLLGLLQVLLMWVAG